MHPALDYAARIAYSSREVLQFSYDMAVKYKDMPDVCYVECGCAAGAQVIAMKAGAPFKVVYAFDSFAGIPLASNKDNQAPGLHFFTKAEQMALPDPGKQVLQSSGATVVSLQDFCSHIVSSGINGYNIYPVQGWFEETIPKFSEKIEPIAILRLDGDLYNSTYVCLKYLYPKVIEGGLIIIDDWALPGCRQAVEDYIIESLTAEHAAPLLTANMRFIKDKNSTVAHWTK